jgi:hypothetical protein
LLAVALLGGGCGSEEPAVQTSTQPRTSPAADYQRRIPEYFKGIDEPQADGWPDMVADASRLLEDGVNTVTVEPPVLIAHRAGKRPRLIMEGEAASARETIDKLHAAGLAVQLAPTTMTPDLNPQVDTTKAALEALDEDTLSWAETAESQQVELFSPLLDYNLVLGTEADSWSSSIVPRIREKYHGILVARVVADIGTPPPGTPHDFKALHYQGYDYLMLDIYPQGDTYDQEAFSAYVDDVMKSAMEVAQRDGLKGVIVGFGGWRETAVSGTVDGPLLGADGQAAMAASLLAQVMPQAKGVFFQGWTLPGRGARGYPVEDSLRTAFGGPGQPSGTPAAPTPPDSAPAETSGTSTAPPA